SRAPFLLSVDVVGILEFAEDLSKTGFSGYGRACPGRLRRGLDVWPPQCNPRVAATKSPSQTRPRSPASRRWPGATNSVGPGALWRKRGPVSLLAKLPGCCRL